MRLFFALWPRPDTARALAAWAEEVARDTGGKPVAAEKIHLTLAFLGEADYKNAIAAAELVRCEAFTLPLEISQYWKHNQIVWVGPERTPDPLERLVQALQFELHRAGFILERRPFAAHVTLLRKARTPPTLPDLPQVQWPTKEFVLVQSRTSSGGQIYATLKTFPLTGSQTTG
jgi:2'-5' RNA ligase